MKNKESTDGLGDGWSTFKSSISLSPSRAIIFYFQSNPIARTQATWSYRKKTSCKSPSSTNPNYVKYEFTKSFQKMLQFKYKLVFKTNEESIAAPGPDTKDSPTLTKQSDIPTPSYKFHNLVNQGSL